MKFTAALSVLAFMAAAFAEEDPPPTRVEQRQASVVQGVLSQVSAAIGQLDMSVKAFNGDPNAVTTDAGKLVDLLKSSTDQIKASQALGLTDAVGLVSVSQAMQMQGQMLVDDLRTKKPAFEAAGLCGAVGGVSKQISDNSRALIDAVVAKVPAAAQSIAQGQVGGITAVLDQGAQLFAAGNCTNRQGGAGMSSMPGMPGMGTMTSSGTTSVPGAMSTSSMTSSMASSMTSSMTTPGAGTTTLRASSRPAMTTGGINVTMTVQPNDPTPRSSTRLSSPGAAAQAQSTTTMTMTMTMTPPCACPGSSTTNNMMTTSSASRNIPAPQATTPMTTPMTTRNMTTTRAMTTTRPAVTAAAVINTVGPVGIIAGVAMAYLL